MIVVTKCRVRFIEIAFLWTISAKGIRSSIDVHVTVFSNASSLGDMGA